MREIFFLFAVMAATATLSDTGSAETKQQEFVRAKFWQGVDDVKPCEALMRANGYDEHQWQKCVLAAAPEHDIDARFLGENYEGARYQVEMSHLVPGHRISLIPGISFLRRIRSDDPDGLCVAFQLDCNTLRTVIAETSAEMPWAR